MVPVARESRKCYICDAHFMRRPILVPHPIKKSPTAKTGATQPVQTGSKRTILYASKGLWLFIIVVSGFIYFSRPSTGADSPVSSATNKALPAPPNPANLRPDGSTSHQRHAASYKSAIRRVGWMWGFDQMIETGQKQVLVVNSHGRNAWFTKVGAQVMIVIAANCLCRRG